MPHCSSGPLHQRGLSLIEVLVAVVVFSIGLLGTAKLLMLQERLGAEADYRSLAVTMAEDLIERLKLEDGPRRQAYTGSFEFGAAQRITESDDGLATSGDDSGESLMKWAGDWNSRYAIPALKVCAEVDEGQAAVVVVWRVQMALTPPEDAPSCVTDRAEPAHQRWVAMAFSVDE